MERNCCSWYSIVFWTSIVICIKLSSSDKSLGRDNLGKSVVDNMNKEAILIMPYLKRIICQLNTVKTLYIYYEEEVQLKNNIVKNVHEECTMPVIIERINSSKAPSTLYGSKRFILVNLVKINQNLRNFCPFLKITLHEKHNIRIIFVIENTMNSPKPLESLFKELWNRQFINVIAIYKSDIIRIVTFNPFFKNFSEILEISNLTKDDIFYDKTRNLNQYPINVSLFAEDARVIFSKDYKLTGTDASVSKMIETQMNANFIYSDRFDSFGEFLPNGTPTQSLAKIINREVEMSFNLRVFRISGFQGVVEVTHINERSDLCIIVPYETNLSQFNNLFKGFDYMVWSFMSLLFFVTTILWNLIIFMSRNKNCSVSYILLNMIGIKLGQPITKIPLQWPLRVLTIFFIIYALFLTSAFKSNLIVTLLKSSNGTQIDTMEQLASTDFPLLIYDRYRLFIEDNLNYSNPIHRQIGNRLLTVNETVYSEYLKNSSEVGYINKKHLTMFYVNERRHFNKGKPVYHHMSQCPVPILQTYAMTLGSPYLGKVNHILRCAQEGGLFNYWQSYLKGQIEVEKSSLPADSHANVPLGLQHVQAAFSLLALGMIISFCIFILELLIYFLKY